MQRNPRILVLYHSSWGHIEAMAQAVAEGASSVDDVDVDVRRVPELMTVEAMNQAGMKVEQDAPVAKVDELADYDAIVFGTPTRFGNMASQMRNFLDQTGSLWSSGALVGKVGSVFVSTGIGGGNETTITSFHTTLFHLGMIVVGLPYTNPEIAQITEMRGGSPYGAGTIAGPDGSRQPSENELNQARFQGRHVAEITKRLLSGAQQEQEARHGTAARRRVA